MLSLFLCEIFDNRNGGDEEGNGERWVEVISWEPRAVVYHNFLVNLFFIYYFLSDKIKLRLEIFILIDQVDFV